MKNISSKDKKQTSIQRHENYRWVQRAAILGWHDYGRIWYYASSQITMSKDLKTNLWIIVEEEIDLDQRTLNKFEYP